MMDDEEIDPFVELLDVEANDLDDKELEDLMSPMEKMRMQLQEKERVRKEKEEIRAKLDALKKEKGEVEGEENEEEKPDEGEEEEENKEGDGKTTTLFDIRITKATEWKQKGNEAFACGETKLALKNYQGALIFLRGIENHVLAGDAWMAGGGKNPWDVKKAMDRGSHPTNDQLDQWRALKIDCLNNIITCLFKEKEEIQVEDIEEEARRFSKIVKNCDEILEIRPKNVKALFKKGKAYFMTDKYDEAYELFRRAEANTPGPSDKQLTSYLRQCESLLNIHYKEMMGMFKGVFDKMAVAEDREKREAGMKMERNVPTPYFDDPRDDEDENDTEKQFRKDLPTNKFVGVTPRERNVPYNIILD